ncbi:MAG TPA: VWA domain-containing protein [Vicinamibacteria bacterium]|nr:VWA domain-containing protein [Vicinamibacteria bacterium]
MPHSRRTGSGAALGLLLAARVAGQEPPHLLPRVETSRVVLEARVTDASGRPLPGLGPDDFRVEVDGRRTPLESAVWVAESPTVARALPTASSPPTPPAPGRLVVLLFQKDFEGSRLRGLLRAIRQAKDLVEPFSPRDRVAVLTYDSHLRLHLDFTADFDAVRRILDESVLLRWPEPIPPGVPPSLAAHLDREEARKAGSPEEALLALGRALLPIPGAKTVLFFGWGLGQLVGGVVVPDHAYDAAREALERASAAVFCLDVTEAAWHSLEVGLQQVAEDTGGQYFKVHENAGAALARVAAALAGHYVLTFERPEGRRGEHRLRLALARRRGTVLTRTRYVD